MTFSPVFTFAPNLMQSQSSVFSFRQKHFSFQQKQHGQAHLCEPRHVRVASLQPYHITSGTTCHTRQRQHTGYLTIPSNYESRAASADTTNLSNMMNATTLYISAIDRVYYAATECCSPHFKGPKACAHKS